MRIIRRIGAIAILAACVLRLGTAYAEEALVAVAANFKAPAEAIAGSFHTATGDQATLSFGSSGEFVTAIDNGAPFDVFLSADAERPAKLATDGKGVAGTVMTYATGRLALWSKDPAKIDATASVLKTGSFTKLAIADPKLAPYGAAAVETLQHLGLTDAVQAKLVQGNSIAQAYAFVATGNADLGFVALSQIAGDDTGSRWVVPENLHAPITQDAILLQHGATNKAARAFLAFLKSPAARAIIERFGYQTAPPGQP